ncbi:MULTISPECIES: outer membrane protein assembly factor BamC [unclassified Agarivorans]|uniref:outer membrane protein assembly factor BamC n=1 Tax=unclassified Agarivorans TaxID=2636026 RepID=UPI0026E2270F|nr:MULTISPECIES: outer membrane protein assembly factor BamC [unclassified Agarivorans]MDO6687978.1 outer membrane protein assembly factor BamC [Agarivorans sp. 3_MG-2023]MDO6717605.1 outer membrane protein assembly factor BamC [Agarivorans sp. 2_MG-2023]
MQLVSFQTMKVVFFGSLVATLAACSSSGEKNRQAERNFDYLEATQVEPLAIPAGVNPPEYSSEFVIPEPKPDSEELFGREVDVRAPVQVIPLIAGSRIEDTDDGLIFWFDILQAESAVETQSTMMQTISDYIAYRKSTVVQRNDQQAFIASDWLVDRETVEGNWWLFSSDTVMEQRQKFTYQLEVKPHGRTAGLRVSFIDGEIYRDGNDEALELDDFDKQRLAVVELNRLIGYVNDRREELEAQLAEQREQTRIAAMSESEKEQLFDETVSLVLVNDSGASYFKARADMEKTMKRLRLVLPLAGFTITDYIANSGSLYLTYDRPPEQILETYGLTTMEFEEKDYLFTVGSNGNVTQITLADAEGVVLKPSEVKALYPYLAILMKMGIDTSDSLSR